MGLRSRLSRSFVLADESSYKCETWEILSEKDVNFRRKLLDS